MKKLSRKNIESSLANAEVFSYDFKTGLTSEQVKIRQKEGLINKSRKRPTKSVGKILFDNLLNPLNILLLTIFVIMIFANLPPTRYFFMIVLIGNSGIGLIQDFKARSLVSKLSIVNEPKITVIRNGIEEKIPSKSLVFGDIVVISNGDQVPSDCLIQEGNCSVNESMLTGESQAINKTIKDELYAGSYLTSGKVKAKVIKVGCANYIEKLQDKATEYKRPNSEIKKTVNYIIAICFISVVFFGIANYFISSKSLDLNTGSGYATFAQGLSGSLVSMIPSGMYLLTSLTLAVGVILLAKKRMLVQQLYCIEMLARVDMVCLDKTGTLTNGDMKVEELIPFSDYSEKELKEILSTIVFGTKDNNQTNEAIKGFIGKEPGFAVKKYIPFDSAKKFSAVETEDGETFALGAYGFVNCVLNKKIEETISEKSKQGLRVLCLYKNKKGFKNGGMAPLSKIIALITISNSIKPDAAPNIKWFQDNGVEIRIISGDNPLTVSYIAKVCGVKNYEKLINCELLSDDELIEASKTNVIFGRVSPEQKELLINTFKKSGKKVAMTGDGVNDILALKVADCSIAMANGSSAATNVSHIVSLENDFSKLPNVVEEGRRVINNLQRSCSLFLTKTIFAVLVTLFFDLLFLINGDLYPFSTSNMLIWEFVTIGIASFLLALQPSKEKLQGSFARHILIKAIPSGIAESCTVFLAYWVFWNNMPQFTALSVCAFTVLSCFILFNVCRPFDKYRVFVFLGCIVCALGILVLDIFNPSWQLLDVNWSGLTWEFPVSLLGISIVCAGIYFGLDILFRKKLLEKGDNNDE